MSFWDDPIGSVTGTVEHGFNALSDSATAITNPTMDFLQGKSNIGSWLDNTTMAATNATLAPFTGKGDNPDARGWRNAAAIAAGGYYALPYLTGAGAAASTAPEVGSLAEAPGFYGSAAADTAYGSAISGGAGEQAAAMTAEGVAAGAPYSTAAGSAGITGGGAGAAGGGAGAAGGASGGATAAGMSTPQKIALGLGGANALYGMFGPKPSIPNLVNPTIQNAGNQLIDQALKGQLNPGDMGRIAQSRTQDLAKTAEYYAKAGLSDSSMAQSAAADVNARYDQAAYQITQGYYQQGIAAAGITNSQVAQQVQLQMQQDQAAQQAQSSFFNALMMYGMMG